MKSSTSAVLALTAIVSACAPDHQPLLPLPPAIDQAAVVVSPPALNLPPALLQAGEFGTVIVRCTITAEGLSTGCAIVQIVGNPALRPAALTYIAQLRFHAARRGNENVPEPGYLIELNYGPPEPPDIVADDQSRGPPIFSPQIMYPVNELEHERMGAAKIVCQIQPNGHTSGCQLDKVYGGADFGAAALTYAEQTVFPANDRAARHEFITRFTIHDSGYGYSGGSTVISSPNLPPTAAL